MGVLTHSTLTNKDLKPAPLDFAYFGSQTGLTENWGILQLGHVGIKQDSQEIRTEGPFCSRWAPLQERNPGAKARKKLPFSQGTTLPLPESFYLFSLLENSLRLLETETSKFEEFFFFNKTIKRTIELGSFLEASFHLRWRRKSKKIKYH